MQNFIKKYIITLLCIVFLSEHVFAIEISGSSEAINVAGKQRMLSYRILKDYLMISMESRYKDPKGDMERSIQQFSEAKKALAAYSDDIEIQILVKEVENAFSIVKEMVEQPFDSSKENIYLQKSTQMKELSHKVVLRLQALSGTKSAMIVNKSGRLRAISQRINALYLMKTLGVSSPVITDGMKVSMKLFRDNLDFLKKAELQSPEVLKRLKKLEKIYLFFQIMNESDNHVPTIITKKSDKMLKYSDELTTIYVKNSSKEEKK